MAAHWDGVIGHMLQREMEALGVLRSRDVDSELVWGDSEEVWSEAPVTDQIDWSTMFVPSSLSLDGLREVTPPGDGGSSLESAASGFCPAD
jgi:hypothetical protein